MLNTPRRNQKLRILLIALFSLYVMIGTSLYFFQEKLLFHPTILEQDFKFEFDSNFEEVFIKTEDGSRLNAIHFKGINPKGVILYFHGNAGNLERWGKITEYFVDLEYDVLVMDYRTYGKSTGVLSETKLYSDAMLFYSYLVEQYDANKIVLYGRSLGSGIATKIASEVNDVNQLILETPYYSIADVAHMRFPIFPVRSLLKYKIPTFHFMKSVKCPVTIIHGTRDRVVPIKSAIKLKDSTNIPINFIEIPEGSHNDLMTFDLYKKTIGRCLK